MEVLEIFWNLNGLKEHLSKSYTCPRHKTSQAEPNESKLEIMGYTEVHQTCLMAHQICHRIQTYIEVVFLDFVNQATLVMSGGRLDASPNMAPREDVF